jgi:protein involved in polysaccharide export with SLBB domain
VKWFTASAFIIVLAGCPTQRPIDGSPTELQQRISSGELLQPGDRVRIVTADQKTHRFAITKIDTGLIVGPNGSVPVDQVMSLEVENAKAPWRPHST